jgi:hypothetical protein
VILAPLMFLVSLFALILAFVPLGLFVVTGSIFFWTTPAFWHASCWPFYQDARSYDPNCQRRRNTGD